MYDGYSVYVPFSSLFFLVRLQLCFIYNAKPPALHYIYRNGWSFASSQLHSFIVVCLFHLAAVVHVLCTSLKPRLQIFLSRQPSNKSEALSKNVPGHMLTAVYTSW